jgi:ribosomal protein S18 acetylase RimI-like enzyme
MHQHHYREQDDGSVVVRQATRKDLDDTSALIGAAFSEFRRLVPDDLFERYIQDSMAIDLSLQDRAVFVAEGGGRIVGTVTFYSDASRTGLDLPEEWASFRTLAVHPGARRQGIANQLVALCVALAERQSPTLAIHTGEFMTSARRLYTRFGFERSPEHDHLASDLLGTEKSAGDVLVMGYRLALPTSVMLDGADLTPVLLVQT